MMSIDRERHATLRINRINKLSYQQVEQGFVDNFIIKVPQTSWSVQLGIEEDMNWIAVAQA